MQQYRDRCEISWCDIRQPHVGRHTQTLGTWMGTVPGLRQGRTLQLLVYGHSEDVAHPVLALINPNTHTLEQQNVELSWSTAMQLAAQIGVAAQRFQT